MNKKLRILFFGHNGKPYGANKSLLTLIKYLNRNHDVELIVPFSNSLKDEYNKNNIKQIILPYFSTIFYIRKKSRYVLYPFLQLLNILIFPVLFYEVRKFKPDIIYSNCSVENIGLTISKLLRIKHITHVREFGDLDYSFIPIFGLPFKRWYLNKSDGIIFNSNVVQNHVLPLPFQKTFCKTIYNGIELNDIDNKFNDSKIIYIGIVGSLHSGKGQLDALIYLTDILLSRADLFLNIYGDGEKKYLNKLREYTRDHRLETKVRFAGFVKDTRSIFKNIDILVVFSKNEAFGRVTIEAMKAGVPVLGFNSAGTAELIEDGVDGFLFKDKKSFYEKIEKLIFHKDLYQLISDNSREKVVKLFSEEIYTKNIEQFIIQVCSN